MMLPDASEVIPSGRLKVEYRAQPFVEDAPPDPARVLTTYAGKEIRRIALLPLSVTSKEVPKNATARGF